MVKQERINQQPDNKRGKTRNRPQNRRARLRTWIRVRWRWTRIRRWQIARWATLIVVVVGGLVLASRYVSGDTDPIQFVTGNLLNVLIFGAIVAQVLIYRKQRDIMRHQWRSMQGQLNAMERQEQAMRDQAKSMDKSVVFGLRAYLGIFSIVFNPETKLIFVQIENTGKVPAENIDVLIEVEAKYIRPTIQPVPMLRILQGEANTEPAPLVIARRYRFGEKATLLPGTLKIGISVPLVEPWINQDQIDAIESNDIRLVVRGNINFMDGFNKDKNSFFAFRYRKPLWYPHPLPSVDDLRIRQIEELPYFEDEDESETNPHLETTGF